MEQKDILEAMKRLVGPSIQVGWFTPKETADLVAASYMYDIGVFIRLNLATGLSIAEINALHWDSLEYDLGSDYEYYNLCVSEVRYDTPLPLCNTPNYVRTGCCRKLSLPVNTGRELVQWCELHAIRNTPYMLVEENGDLMAWYRLSRKYNQMIRAAHVRPLAFDALRNTFVFNALNAGLSVDVIELIPFDYSVPKDQQDPYLLNKLLAERDAVCTEAMRHYMKLKSNNYSFTNRDAYIQDLSFGPSTQPYELVRQFSNEYCEFTNPETFIYSQELYEAFVKKYGGDVFKDLSAFSQAFYKTNENRVDKDRKRTGNINQRGFYGVRLKEVLQ